MAHAQSAREKAGALTTELASLHKQWQKSAGAGREQLLRELGDKAEQRRQLLGELILSQPGEVLRVAIPEDRQRGMPPEVVARLEQRLDMEGELEVLYEDYADGSHKLRHLLKTPFGERFELHFAQPLRQWRSGLKVRVQGWLLERADHSNGIHGDIALTDDDSGLLQLDGGTTTTGTGTSELAYDLPNTLGAQRTLAVLVNFQDQPDIKPWTVSELNNLLFNTVSEFYKENSTQQAWLTGDVAGWYTLPLPSTSCNASDIALRAKEAAQAAGFNVANYDRFVFVFPQTNACGYTGLGQVGAWPSNAWINGSMTLRTLGHELGHNLGLRHASALDCGTTTLGSNCTSQDYGDTLDIMGYTSTVAHFNTFNKERLGWLDSSNLIDVSSSGSFHLQPNAKASSGTKTLKIAKGIDPTSGQPAFYYVEFRQPVGFDAQLIDRGVIDGGNIFSGVTIRQAVPELGRGYLLDMTPGSTTVDMRDAALVGGQSYSDPDSGVTITTEWADAEQALVSVDLSASSGGQTCTRGAPAVSLTPGQSSWLASGSSYTYTVTVTSQDSSGCTDSSFSLAASQPSGWSAGLGSTGLSLTPGASASTTLQVTSPATATDGFYTIDVNATANGMTGSASASFVVDNPVTPTNQPPTAVNDSSQLSSVTTVNVPVMANDSDPEGDKLNIVTFTQGSKGSVSLNSDGTLRYSPGKSFKTGDQFSYTISDGKDTASATVSVSLSSGTGGNKGNGR